MPISSVAASLGQTALNRLRRAVVNLLRQPTLYLVHNRNFLIRPVIGVQNYLYNDQDDLWYLADKLLDPLVSSIEFCASNYGRPLFISILMVLTLFVGVAYTIGLPFWLLRFPSVAWFALVIGNWLLFNVLHHMWQIHRLGPGFVEADSVSWKETVSECYQCKLLRPARAHHCRVCGRCVKRMDHHCPWLNICIGRDNYKHFFMLCLCTWLGALFVALFGLPIAIEHYFGFAVISGDIPKCYGLDWQSSAWKRFVLFEAGVCAAVLIAMGAFLCLHVYLICKGETTIERLMSRRKKGRFESATKIGMPRSNCVRDNWIEVFELDYPSTKVWHLFWPTNLIF